MDNYYGAFQEVLVFIITGVLFILFTLFVSRMIRPARPTPEKLSTYESGEEALSSAWPQFNIRFYVIALMFLLFEVEIVLLFPWALAFAEKKWIEQTNGAWGWFSMWEMIIFVGVLALGLIYVWRKGHLDWAKPSPKVTRMNSPVPPALYQQLNEKYKEKK